MEIISFTDKISKKENPEYPYFVIYTEYDNLFYGVDGRLMLEENARCYDQGDLDISKQVMVFTDGEGKVCLDTLQCNYSNHLTLRAVEGIAIDYVVYEGKKYEVGLVYSSMPGVIRCIEDKII